MKLNSMKTALQLKFIFAPRGVQYIQQLQNNWFRNVKMKFSTLLSIHTYWSMVTELLMLQLEEVCSFSLAMNPSHIYLTGTLFKSAEKKLYTITLLVTSITRFKSPSSVLICCRWCTIYRKNLHELNLNTSRIVILILALLFVHVWFLSGHPYQPSFTITIW